MIPTKLTQINIVELVKSEKLYIETLMGNEKPVGNADNDILIYAPSYNGRKATVVDIPQLMKFVGYSVYVTPAKIPESNFAEGIVA